jgi:hypothetical protein
MIWMQQSCTPKRRVGMNVVIMEVMRMWMVTLMMVEGNQKVKVVCNGKQTSLLMLFLLMSHYLQNPVNEADVNHGYELVDEKDVKKMCFICTISFPMQAFSKRQWQWHNKRGSNSSRKCISCIKKFLSKSGSIGHLLVRDHALSNGLVDGKLHHVSGKIIKDRAMQCQLIDRESANNLYHDFLSKFRLSSMSVEDIVSFGMNTESYQRFILMASNQPNDPIPSNCIYDFLTTIRNP